MIIQPAVQALHFDKRLYTVESLLMYPALAFWVLELLSCYTVGSYVGHLKHFG